MINEEVLDAYLYLQDGIIFDRLINVYSNESVIAFCKLDEATYWNFALVKQILSEQKLKNLEEEFIKLKRTPSIYFENNSDFSPLKNLLVKKGYKESYEDSWMFYEKRSVDLPENYKEIIVSNEQELNIFLDIFNKCYQKGDPQNPYGELGADYLTMLSNAWYRNYQSQKIEYFIFYDNKIPVAVSTLTNYKNMAYISNVGSLPAVRGQGFGKLATLHCVKKSLQKGHSYQFLATEAGSYPYEFYQRLGFKLKFTAIDYAK